MSALWWMPQEQPEQESADLNEPAEEEVEIDATDGQKKRRRRLVPGQKRVVTKRDEFGRPIEWVWARAEARDDWDERQWR